MIGAPVILILKGANDKEIAVPSRIAQEFTNLSSLPKQGEKVKIHAPQVTAEMIHMVMVFYQAYVESSSSIARLKYIIERKPSNSDFYRLWTILAKQPNKMIHLLWVANYLGALALRQFLMEALEKTMGKTEISTRLKEITMSGVALSCDACRRKKAEYVNQTRDRFFCSRECFNAYKL